MIPVETASGIRGGGDRGEQGGRNSSKIYLIHFKKLCKCYAVPPPSTTIIIKRWCAKSSQC
jgi:hypothetical protein